MYQIVFNITYNLIFSDRYFYLFKGKKNSLYVQHLISRVWQIQYLSLQDFLLNITSKNKQPPQKKSKQTEPPDPSTTNVNNE